jgi:PilZ domain
MGLAQLLKQSLGLAERREHPRHDAPRLTLKFGGRKYRALDWSLGGCKIPVSPGELQARQRLEGRLTLQGADASGKFVAEVVRLEGTAAGLRWLELSPEMFVAMGPGAALGL